MEDKIKCSECVYCFSASFEGKKRKEYACSHPDQDYIIQYFEEKGLFKLAGFLGFGMPSTNLVPIKTSPPWCPFKKHSSDSTMIS